MSVFTPLIVAAVAGTFTSHAIFGARMEFEVPVRGAELVEMPVYLLLAVLAGLLAPVMTRSIMWTSGRFEALEIPEWSKPGLGGLAVGLLGAVAFTDLLGPGRSTVELALQAKGQVEGAATDCPRWDFTIKAINRFENPSLYFYRQKGVFIFGIRQPGNASGAGMQINDILFKIDGKPISTLEDVKALHKEALDSLSTKTKMVLTLMPPTITPAMPR